MGLFQGFKQSFTGMFKRSRTVARLEQAPAADPHPVPKSRIDGPRRRDPHKAKVDGRGQRRDRTKSERSQKRRSNPLIGTFRHHLKKIRAAERRQRRKARSS